MVTGKGVLTAFEPSAEILSPPWRTKDLRFAFDLGRHSQAGYPAAAILTLFLPWICGLPLIFGWRLAGWLSRSLPQRLPIPDCSARAWQECGLQTGANKIKTK
ncbi:MAG: hypothetical protein ABSA42_09625 [Terracidiphilus sp.]